MESNLIRRAVRKTKNILGLNHSVQIKSAKWMKAYSEKFADCSQRKFDKNIETNGDTRTAYPKQSRMIEYAIKDILHTEDISFQNMWIIKNPFQYAPLCAMALFKTKKPCAVKVTVKGKNIDCDICYTISSRKTHRVPIMGLYADYENQVVFELLNNKGKSYREKVVTINTAPLKGKIADLKVTHEVSTKKYLYGLTLVYGGDDGIYPYAFDRKGDIRFVFTMIPKTYGFQPISGGKFLFLSRTVTRLTFTNTASTQLYEVDQMGRFYRTYNVEKGAHHDFAELDDGNLVMAGNSVAGKTYEDTVIEVDRKTGDIVNEIRVKDYIDTKYVNTPDWAHLNTVEYNKDEKTVMVCLRNLHTVLKIDYENKKLMWILGHPTFWQDSKVQNQVLTPVGDDMKWFFQAHAAYTIHPINGKKNKTYVMIYDNHRDKRQPVSFFDHEEKSNVMIYEIDEKEKTVKLFYTVSFEQSTIRSNAIYEKSAGRVLAMNGKLKKNPGNRKGSIIEFDYDSKEVLNQYSMNYGFYRAYEFWFATDEMAHGMNLDTEYVLGKHYALEACGPIRTDKEKILPEPVLEQPDSTEEERKTRLAKLCKKNPDYYVDPEQDMARINLTIEEDTAYFSLLDHQLERIYFVGENHTYYRDFTDTKQERPEYFARANHIDAIPLGTLENDSYKIYFKHSTGLYQSKFFIEIREETE